MLSFGSLSPSERRVYQSVVASLSGRLSEQTSIDWALGLIQSQVTERMAVLSCIAYPGEKKIAEPWQTAWRLIEESWEGTFLELDRDMTRHLAIRRIAQKDRSGALISLITKMVSPVLELTPLSQGGRRSLKPKKRQRKLTEILTARLSSGKVVNPDELGLQSVSEAFFLTELAHELTRAIIKGQDIAERLQVIGFGRWVSRDVHRVYFVNPEQRSSENEPDEFNRGLAPSVKLLHSVARRLHLVSPERASNILATWRVHKTPIWQRLWAASALNTPMVSAADVAAFLEECNDREFWFQFAFPEIAELRAHRLGDLATKDQSKILSRVLKGPPRSILARFDKDKIDGIRNSWIFQELRRIEVVNGDLPGPEGTWLDTNRDKFPELQAATRDDFGFPGSPEAKWVTQNPDKKFDILSGEERLAELESDLTTARRAFSADPAGRASAWIESDGNTELLLSDLEGVNIIDTKYSKVTNLFGYYHRPRPLRSSKDISSISELEMDELDGIAQRGLSVISKMSQDLLVENIDAVTSWLEAWSRYIASLETVTAIWLQLWPLAVASTGGKSGADSAVGDATLVASDDFTDDLHAANTPVGKLIRVFLEVSATGNRETPFENPDLRRMRELIANADGAARTIALSQLIEWLGWFLWADEVWTTENLLPHLLNSEDQSRIYWRALARQQINKNVVSKVGREIAKRAVDLRIDRETRRSLVFAVVVEILFSFVDNRAPVIDLGVAQQMIRSLDDEVRASAADTIGRFVRDVSNEEDMSREVLFERAARPFLQTVWPQERSLSTPGLARAFADLPASCRGAFADAVEAIEKFLVPFDCWSMLDYGIYPTGDSSDFAKLSIIDNERKAEALLKLLDVTISSADGAVVPMDLAAALEQVASVSTRAATSATFRRLGALSRR